MNSVSERCELCMRRACAPRFCSTSHLVGVLVSERRHVSFCMEQQFWISALFLAGLGQSLQDINIVLA